MVVSDKGQAENETGGSVAQLAGDLTTLIRQQVELAKTEIAEKAKSAGTGASMLGASALAGFITLGCLTALVVLLLTLVLPGWIAALVVTVLWAVATAVLALLGKRNFKDAVPFVPEQTIHNLKEDVAWARGRAKRSRT